MKCQKLWKNNVAVGVARNNFRISVPRNEGEKQERPIPYFKNTTIWTFYVIQYLDPKMRQTVKC